MSESYSLFWWGEWRVMTGVVYDGGLSWWGFSGFTNTILKGSHGRSDNQVSCKRSTLDDRSIWPQDRNSFTNSQYQALRHIPLWFRHKPTKSGESWTGLEWGLPWLPLKDRVCMPFICIHHVHMYIWYILTIFERPSTFSENVVQLPLMDATSRMRHI